ncbi:MAG: hypothetical protein AAF798_17570 [Bacteroidota bacterium]
MKKPRLEQLVYLKKEVFISLHEYLVEQLKARYEERGLAFRLAKSERNGKDSSEMTTLSSFSYGKSRKLTNGALQEIGRIEELPPTLIQIFRDNPAVKTYREKILNKKNGSGSEHLHFYNLKTWFSKYPDHIKQVDNFKRLISLLLVQHPELEIDEELSFLDQLEEKGYWQNTPNAKAEIRPHTIRREIDFDLLDYQHYIGVFFSILAFQVKYIILSISKDEVYKDEQGNSVYAVIERGLHALEPLSKQGEDTIFKGFVTKTGKYHYAGTLLNPKREAPLMIQWDLSGNNTDCFRATIQGASFKGERLLGMEVIFYGISEEQYEALNKNPYDQILDPPTLAVFSEDQQEELTSLCFYSALQRRIFAPVKGYVEKEIINHESRLKLAVRKNLVRNVSYIGTFRILQFCLRNETIDGNGQQLGLIQSRLVIRKDGIVTLETMQGGRVVKLKCTLHPSEKPQAKKLHVFAYSDASVQICNLGIFDFNQRGPYRSGLFASVGSNDRGIYGGYIVFSEDESRFESRVIEPDQVTSYLRAHDLTAMYNRLEQLHKDKMKYFFEFFKDMDEF